MTDQQSFVEGGQTLKGSLFVILSAVLIFFTLRYESLRRYQKEKELREVRSETKERAFKASEEERNRIASELHDGIQQDLAGISLIVERAKEEDKQDLKELQQAIDNCIEEVRSSSHNLSSLHLDQKGLVEALDDLSIRNKDGEQVDLSIEKQKNGLFIVRFQEETPHRKGSKGIGIGEQTIQKGIESLDGEILSMPGPEEEDSTFTFSFRDRGTL